MYINFEFQQDQIMVIESQTCWDIISKSKSMNSKIKSLKSCNQENTERLLCLEICKTQLINWPFALQSSKNTLNISRYCLSSLELTSNNVAICHDALLEYHISRQNFTCPFLLTATVPFFPEYMLICFPLQIKLCETKRELNWNKPKQFHAWI